MKRRTFIKNIGATSLLLGAGAWSTLSMKANSTLKQITILHTNDTHSHIDPLPANDPLRPNKGGAARRALLINQIRTENPNTLLFLSLPHCIFYRVLRALQGLYCSHRSWR